MRLKTTILSAAALFGMLATQPAALLHAQDVTTDAATTTAATSTTVTNLTGTITSVNYSTDGTIQGFLIGTNVLLTFQSNVTGGIATLGAAGNSVTYSGTEVTDTTTGFSTVRVTSFTNNTTKATYTAPTPGTTTTTATAYTATGTIKQLNYDSNGLINGFVFTASGSTTSVLVVIGATNNTTLQSLLKVGMTASVTGTERTASTTTGSLATVNASSLTISGTTIIISGGGFGGGSGPGHGPGR